MPSVGHLIRKTHNETGLMVCDSNECLIVLGKDVLGSFNCGEQGIPEVKII